MVIWIVGLSGSGKSYLGRKLNAKLKNSILVDGDDIRKIITHDLGYTKKDREKNSLLIQKICKFLEYKKFTVICSILSIFPSHQKKNRKLFKNYFQIYIKANKSKLIKNNSKKVYNKKNVVGLDIKFPTPKNNNLILNNNFKKISDKKINEIVKKINDKKKN